jgi:beta-phosphoglucomutase-like phosphatase (HAD superfamily)
MRAPDLVLFDCDGVLVDSEKTANEVLAAILGEQGIAITALEAQTHFVGQSVEAIPLYCIDRFGITLAADWHVDYYARLLPALASVSPISGANGLVERLLGIGQPICVASQGPVEKMRITLGAVGLLEHFEGRMFSAKAVERSKPAPDLFLHAAKILGARPADCVVIEDSVLGVQAGIAAGMRVLAYCPPAASALMRELGAYPIHHIKDAAGLLGAEAGIPELGPDQGCR